MIVFDNLFFRKKVEVNHENYIFSHVSRLLKWVAYFLCLTLPLLLRQVIGFGMDIDFWPPIFPLNRCRFSGIFPVGWQGSTDVQKLFGFIASLIPTAF